MIQTDNQTTLTSSTGNLPHIRETITMLYLAVCQIETSVNESNKSVNELTQSFTELAQHSREVDEHVQQMTDLSELDSIKKQVSDTAQEMQKKINQAVTAFQFYDRISQRLAHVSSSLEQVSGVIGNPKNINNQAVWRNIQEKVKDSYSMESERIMFEHIVRGASVKEALEIYQHHFEQQESGSLGGDDIELF